jgi:hypothetical protein
MSFNPQDHSVRTLHTSVMWVPASLLSPKKAFEPFGTEKLKKLPKIEESEVAFGYVGPVPRDQRLLTNNYEAALILQAIGCEVFTFVSLDEEEECTSPLDTYAIHVPKHIAEKVLLLLDGFEYIVTWESIICSEPKKRLAYTTLYVRKVEEQEITYESLGPLSINKIDLALGEAQSV